MSCLQRTRSSGDDNGIADKQMGLYNQSPNLFRLTRKLLEVGVFEAVLFASHCLVCLDGSWHLSVHPA